MKFSSSLPRMALDIYWKEWQHERYVGSLEIDTPLEDLLFAFGKLTGIPIDPYANTRLHPALRLRLLTLAKERAYPSQPLKEITAGPTKWDALIAQRLTQGVPIMHPRGEQ